MGFGGISIWQILIILAIVILLFGTSKLKNVGSDLGSALKGFKKSMKDDDEEGDKKDADFESLSKPNDKSTEQQVDPNNSDKQKQASKD